MSYLTGTKAFLMGDQPVEVDCAIFGLLAQIVWNSRGSPYEPLVNGKITILNTQNIVNEIDCLFK